MDLVDAILILESGEGVSDHDLVDAAAAVIKDGAQSVVSGWRQAFENLVDGGWVSSTGEVLHYIDENPLLDDEPDPNEEEDSVDEEGDVDDWLDEDCVWEE